MSRSCLLFALVASFLFPTLARSARAETALAALRSLPPRYSYSVLRLSANNGRPTPPAWYILARDQTRRGLPTNITISPRGRIISERPSLNPRARINGLSPISIGRMGIDSTNAWNMARQFSSERGRRLGSVSYSLEQHGRGASPVWSVWCYDRSGRYIGFLSILASTGAVISFASHETAHMSRANGVIRADIRSVDSLLDVGMSRSGPHRTRLHLELAQAIWFEACNEN